MSEESDTSPVKWRKHSYSFICHS